MTQEGVMQGRLQHLVCAVLMMGVLAIVTGPLQANPFPKGDAATGKGLHDPRCVSCHNSMFPDRDGTQLYSELFRKSDTPARLKGMIDFCSNRTRAGWFEEDIQHVARYLNDHYYGFK
jgi:mono/diheme cytochrome c family protein